MLLLTATPVLAQTATKAPAPKQVLAQPWASVVVTFFLLVLIAVGSFLSSKRSHQD
jgi:hypothetical protein